MPCRALPHILSLALLFLCACGGGKDEKSASRPPNIVLIISDDHDYEHLGFLGKSQVKTPAIDSMAKGGALFPNGQAMSRCRPALASLLSGLESHRSGIFYNEGPRTLQARPLLPALLKQAGYRTFAQGKFFEGDPKEIGFDIDAGHDFDEFVRKNQSELFTFLDEQGDEPFFVWWAPMLPHVPHDPPERLRAMYPAEAIPVPPWIDPAQAAEYRKLESTSLAMVSWLDEGISSLFAKLRARNLEEETLVAFVIDNGWANGCVSKGSPYEKGLRSPLIFYWKDHIEPREMGELVSILDMVPTLLDYAGAELPSTLQGRSLRPAIESREHERREAIYGACYPAFISDPTVTPEQCAFALHARDERWKYILWLQDLREPQNESYFRIKHICMPFPTRNAGQEELFDLHADPLEHHDLGADPAHAAIRAKLRAGTAAWWAATGGKPLPLVH